MAGDMAREETIKMAERLPMKKGGMKEAVLEAELHGLNWRQCKSIHS